MGVYLEDLTYKEILPILARTGKLIDTRKIIEIDFVRCEGCKYYDTTSRSFPCCTDIYGAVRHMEADDFCSKGERRADGDI